MPSTGPGCAPCARNSTINSQPARARRPRFPWVACRHGWLFAVATRDDLLCACDIVTAFEWHSHLKMHKGLSCPHCGNRGMSLFHKMNTGPGLATACESCGKGIGVPRSILAAYALFWIPLWLSGYVESLALKGALWICAAGVLAVASLAFAPLEARVLDHKVERWPLWVKVWFACCSAAAIAAFSINFFPSREYALISFGVSVVISAPILGVLLNRVKESERQSLKYLVIYGLIVAANYLAIAVVLPAGPVALLGETRESQTKVQYRSKSYKLLNCSRYLELGEDGVLFKKTICVPDEVWQQVTRGDRIAISERHSWLGEFVEGVVLPPPATGT